MNPEESKFLKCDCTQCGGSIEFPPDHGIGEEVTCPHCQHRAILFQAARVKFVCRTCGSHRIGERARGFNAGRALAGTVIGGFMGSSERRLTCLACGSHSITCIGK